MKKHLCFFLAVLFVAAFCACNINQNPLPESSTTDISLIAVSEHVSESSEESLATEPDTNQSILSYFDTDKYEQANEFLLFVKKRFGEEALNSVLAALENNNYTDDIWYEITGNTINFLRSVFLGEDKILPNMRLLSYGEKESGKKTVMTFGGDICFADNYATLPYMENYTNGLSDCISYKWFEEMQNADIAVLNNEFAISNRGEPLKNKLYTYLSKPENTKYYNELGVNFVTLANNHIFDYGQEAFEDTLKTLSEYGIDYAGAGKNAAEAQRPFYYLVNGKKIAFISATRAEKYVITPEATDTDPGVFRCYEPERLLEVIAETKKNCDYIVLFVHWGTEYSSVLETVQQTTAHDYIDAGADIIVGTHAHQLQGIEFYKGKAIFYNLGNFWFNAKNIETGLVRVELDQNGTERFYFLPGVQAWCITSYELGTEKGRSILDNIASYQPNIRIEDTGLIIPESENTAE